METTTRMLLDDLVHLWPDVYLLFHSHSFNLSDNSVRCYFTDCDETVGPNLRRFYFNRSLDFIYWALH